jgi:hypothetical protein
MKVVKTDRTVKLIGKNGSAHAHMVWLSTQFAGVVSPRGAKVGTRLELEMELPAFGTFHTLRIPVIVTERHSTGDGYHLTLSFEEVKEEALDVIKDFIKYKERLHEINFHGVAPLLPGDS